MNPKTEIPNPAITEPELSDAEDTLEISLGTVKRAATELRADRTSEVDASDILSVQVESAENADRTSEVDALDIVSVEALELPTMRMPTLKAPPARVDSVAPVALRTNEPTRIIRRDRLARARGAALWTSARAALKTKRARSVLILAAALGTWGFFASFAIVGGYAAFALVRGSGAPTTPAVAAMTQPSPIIDANASDENASDENASRVAPLLYSDARQSTTASDEPVNRSYARAATVAGDEIFRRPSKTQVGVLRLPSSVSGVLVDGSPQRVSGGALILACGDHRIRPPHASARVVRVPCGKTVTL